MWMEQVPARGLCNGTRDDAVAQAAAGMDVTRIGRAGEPDILAATIGWQQVHAAGRDGAAALPTLTKNAPGSFRGVRMIDRAHHGPRDYLPLEAGAEEWAFMAWWCFPM
jgi:hypothetical protein